MAILVVLMSGVAGWGVASRFHEDDFLHAPRVGLVVSGSSDVDEMVKKERYHNQVYAVLESYCYECHMDGEEKGGVNLDEYMELSAATSDSELWSRVRRQLDLELMPPPDREQPGEDLKAGVMAWIDEEIFPVDSERPDPGRLPWRRINVAEYENAVRDLFGVEIAARELLPPDDAGHGFDTTADSLKLTTAHMQRFLEAADEVMAQAVWIGPMDWTTRESGVEDWQGDGKNDGSYWMLATNGKVGWKMPVEEGRRYRVEIDASADLAGDELPKMEIRFEDRVVETLEVAAERGEFQTLSFEWAPEQAGERWEFAFINDFYAPEVESRWRRDRNLKVAKVRLVGPIDGERPAKPATHRRIFGERLPNETAEAHAERIFQKYARLAFRRPVGMAEVRRYLEFLELMKDEDDAFEQGVEMGLKAILVSPEFLLRGEPAGDSLVGGRQLISQSLLASRLSFFLWSSIPDDALLREVEQGTLRLNLRQQVRRMLADPKARALTENFAGQWLRLRDMEHFRPDRRAFPDFDDSLKADMARETELFFEEIIFNHRPITDFLDADYRFLNRRLAEHYGIRVKGDWEAKDELVKVSRDLLEPIGENGGQIAQIGGLLAQGSVLSLTSEARRTSPVMRGQWILENLLDRAPPPPPGDIPSLEQAKVEGKRLSHREQLEMHRSKPDCAACHRLMDPLGFALENLDPVGRWRTVERHHKKSLPIDASAELPGGAKVVGAAGLIGYLIENEQEAFTKCLIKKMLTYALGRGVEYYDQPAIDQIYERVKANEFSSEQLLLGIIESIPFQQKRAPVVTADTGGSKNPEKTE